MGKKHNNKYFPGKITQYLLLSHIEPSAKIIHDCEAKRSDSNKSTYDGKWASKEKTEWVPSAYSKEKVLEISKRRVYVARYFVPEWLSWMKSSVHICCDVRFEYINVSIGKFREYTQKLMLVWMSKKQTRNRENKKSSHKIIRK